MGSKGRERSYEKNVVALGSGPVKFSDSPERDLGEATLDQEQPGDQEEPKVNS